MLTVESSSDCTAAERSRRSSDKAGGGRDIDDRYGDAEEVEDGEEEAEAEVEGLVLRQMVTNGDVFGSVWCSITRMSDRLRSFSASGAVVVLIRNEPLLVPVVVATSIYADVVHLRDAASASEGGGSGGDRDNQG